MEWKKPWKNWTAKSSTEGRSSCPRTKATGDPGPDPDLIVAPDHDQGLALPLGPSLVPKLLLEGAAKTAPGETPGETPGKTPSKTPSKTPKTINAAELIHIFIPRICILLVFLCTSSQSLERVFEFV